MESYPTRYLTLTSDIHMCIHTHIHRERGRGKGKKEDKKNDRKGRMEKKETNPSQGSFV